MQFTTGAMNFMQISQNMLAVRSMIMQLQAHTTTNIECEYLCMRSLHIVLFVSTWLAILASRSNSLEAAFLQTPTAIPSIPPCPELLGWPPMAAAAEAARSMVLPEEEDPLPLLRLLLRLLPKEGILESALVA